jgi:hypothetical protein
LARRLELGTRGGFRFVRVTVHVGDSTWQTSARGQSWFLPIKRAICRAEG